MSRVRGQRELEVGRAHQARGFRPGARL